MGLDVEKYNSQFLEKVKKKEPIYNDASAKYKVDIKFLPDILNYTNTDFSALPKLTH